MTQTEASTPVGIKDTTYVDQYVERTLDELEVIDANIQKVRELAAAATGSEDPADFHALRVAMTELAHSSALLRTGHPTPLAQEVFDNHEQVLRPPVAHDDGHATWGKEDLGRVDIHHGATGLNRVAAERVANAERREHAEHPISRPAPDPAGTLTTDYEGTSSTVFDPTHEGVHHGKDGLNRPASERQEAVDAGLVKPVPEQVAEKRHAGR